jgi:DNA repair exonuclease SbcCD ATPase subunit
MQYIFHISDIHIDINRVENLDNSFNVLIKDILERGVKKSLLVIVGDIFENKTFLTTNDLFIFNNMMSTLNTNKIRTLLVVGNHDYNINNDNQKQTSLDILINSYSYITCLTKSQIYTVSNVEFYVHSIMDTTKLTIRDNDSIKIALLHDAVNGALYDNDQEIKDQLYNINDFIKYDYTMLGDIHKPQFLTDKIAYCGSFVQKNKGEGIDHGYILWDLIQGVGSHKFIPLKNLYIKITALNNKCKLPTIIKSQKIKYVQLWHRNCSHEFLKNIKVKITKLYGKLNKIVNKDLYHMMEQPLDTTSKNYTKEKSISVDHESCIKSLLAGSKISDKMLSKILSHHSANLQNAHDINYVNYVLNYMTWDNILCYGKDNYVDFKTWDNDIVVINGKNKYGKSSIIDILIRILFNECERGYKRDIVNKKYDSGMIKLSISVPSGTVDGVMKYDEYIIEQILFSSRSEHRLYIREHSTNSLRNITQQTIVHTYTYLREVVGIGSYKDFINMTTALQHRKFLVDLDQEEMSIMLVKMLNIEILTNLIKQTKSEIKLLKHDGKNYISEIVKLNSNVETELKSDILTKSKLKETNVIEKYLSDQQIKCDLLCQNIKNNQSEICEFNKKIIPDLSETDIQDINNKLKNIGNCEIVKNDIDIDSLVLVKTRIEICQNYIRKLSLTDAVATYKDFCKSKLEKKSHNYNVCSEEKYLIKKKEYDVISSRELFSPPVLTLTDVEKNRVGRLDIVVVSKYLKDNLNLYNAIDLERLYKLIQPCDEVPKHYKTILDDINESELHKELKLIECNVSLEHYDDEIEQLYKLLKPCDISMPCEEISFAYADEIILNREISQLPVRINILEQSPIFEQEKLPCIIDPTILQNHSEYKRIITCGLPDWVYLGESMKQAEERIKQFNIQYGMLKFNNICYCCDANKGILSGIINIENEQQAILKMSKKLDDRARIKEEFAYAEECVVKIEKYLLSKKANVSIDTNNKKYAAYAAELSALRKTHNQNIAILKNVESTKLFREITNHNFQIEKNISQRKFEKNNFIKNLSRKNIIEEKLFSKKNILENLERNIKNLKISQKIKNQKNLKSEYEKKSQEHNLYFLIKENSLKSKEYKKHKLQKNKLEDEINSYEFVKYSRELNELEIKKNKMEKTHADFIKTKMIIELTKTRQSILYNQGILKKINKLRTVRDNIMKNHNTVVDDCNQIKLSLTKIKLWRITLTELKEKSTINTSRLEFLELYEKCVNRKGITQIILRDLCSLLNKECNRILHEIADFELDIRYDKTGILRIYTSENGVSIPASMASGYQKFVMDMIMRVVLASCLSNNNNMSNPHILIIDEGFGCLDKKNFVEVAKVMQKLKHKFRFMIIITHIDELKSYADHVINIDRINQESKLCSSLRDSLGISEMQRVQLREVLADKTKRLVDSRADENKKREEKREDAKRIKEDVKKVKEEDKKRVKEDAKRVKEEDKKRIKEDAKRVKEDAKKILKDTMNDENKQIEYLLEVNERDTPVTFKCKCCDKIFVYSEKKMKSHINGKVYKAKHARYIKSIL